eukprot:scaffold60660_cov59-Phaeocystis_antarctica.AAC.5
MAPQRISVARGGASLAVDAEAPREVRICLSIAQRLLLGPPGPAAAASQLGACASERVFQVPTIPLFEPQSALRKSQREPHIRSVREPFRPSVHPVVGEIDEELLARLRCRGYHKCRLRVERGWIACRIAHVHPLRIVEARASRAERHERVRVPAGEVRRYAIEGAVSMAEDSHAFEDGAVRADDACAREAWSSSGSRKSDMSRLGRPSGCKLCTKLNRPFAAFDVATPAWRYR